MTMQHLDVESSPRPEAMADVPGVCELPLTRAVVQYRDVHEVDLAGGRIQDIGLALVLQGRYAAQSQVIDLGSAEVKRLDLSTELVVLDWVYEPTLEHVSELLEARERAREAGPGRELGPYLFDLALRVLDRVGFGPLSRPIVLRIGFRDICRDLDLHEGTSVRIALEPRRLTRAHLDYDASALNFRTAALASDPLLERGLADAFPDQDVRRLERPGGEGAVSYQVRSPLPLTLDEARENLRGMRKGLGRLLARFEPDRYRALEDVLSTLGVRETLGHLRGRSSRSRAVPVTPPAAPGAGGTVH
jgi:hypothetical protein